MKVKDLILWLQQCNQEAKMQVIAHNRAYDFTMTIGSSDGCTKATCDTVALSVDELNDMGESPNEQG